MKPIDIRPADLETVRTILSQHVPDRDVRVFGSRVTWTAKEFSDLDLAVMGNEPLSPPLLANLRDEFSESDLPFKVDIVDWATTKEGFRHIIEKEFLVLQRGATMCRPGPSDWRKVTVGEIAAPVRNELVGGPFGSNLISSDYVAEGVPVIRRQNMGSRYLTGDFAFVTEAKAESLKGNLARPEDIIFTKRGTLGQVSLVPAEPFERYLVSQSQMKLTVNRELADPLFYYYVFSTAEQQDYIRRNAIQTGVPHTNLSILRATSVPLPPLPEQSAIAHILGTLDDKIELNRRMNETLEGIARAIFKSWFVDFDPVRAKAEGRLPAEASAQAGDPGLPKRIADQLSDRFKESELGNIPGGWEVGFFSDLVEQLRDQVNPLTVPDALFRHFSIPAFDDGQWPKVEPGESIKSLKSRVPPGVILLSKLNPEIERVWLVDVEPNDRAVCSTEFLVLHPRTPYGRAYAYCLARSPFFRQQLEALVTGTSKSHQRAQVDAILDLSVILPPKSIVEAFEKAALPLLGRTLACRRESRTLAALRDTLLPKLISGELRVKEAEQIIGRHV